MRKELAGFTEYRSLEECQVHGSGYVGQGYMGQGDRYMDQGDRYMGQGDMYIGGVPGTWVRVRVRVRVHGSGVEPRA